MTAGAYKTELSDVQRETWLRYAQGVPMKVIAIEQGKHVATIEARLVRVRDALGVDSRLGLIKAAVDHGLIEHGELPAGKPGYCPCCGHKFPAVAMRALVMFWHGRGYLETAKALGIRQQTLTYHLEKLKRVYGGRGVQHFLACAVRSGLMKRLLNGDAVGVGNHVERDGERSAGAKRVSQGTSDAGVLPARGRAVERRESAVHAA